MHRAARVCFARRREISFSQKSDKGKPDLHDGGPTSLSVAYLLASVYYTGRAISALVRVLENEKEECAGRRDC
jgi:hypothetical protein